MTWAEDSEGELEFTRPLPAEDRLWRHPSEWSAEQRAGSATVARADTAPPSTPWYRFFGATRPHRPRRSTLAVAGMSALGGALLVAGLSLTLDSADPPVVGAGTSGVVTISRNPVVSLPLQVNADEWASLVATDTAPAVAAVRVTNGDDQYQGSAVVFRSDGLLLTAASLVQDADRVTVTLRNHGQHVAVVLGTDPVSGLAVLYVSDADFPTAPLSLLEAPPGIGDSAVAVGGTGSLDQLAMVEVAGTNVRAAVTNDMNLHGLIVLDKGSAPLATGGAVVDKTGAVIGIVVDVGAQNATYAVPVGYARGIAEDIVNHGSARHPWLAIRGVDVNPNQADLHGAPGAVRLSEIIADGPAQDGGLQVDDLLTSVDDLPVTSMSDLVLALRNFEPQDDVDVTYLRDGETTSASLTLGARPSE